MEEEEIQTQITKFPRLGNGTGTGRADSSKIAHKLADQNYPDDELDTQLKRVGVVGTGTRLTDNGGTTTPIPTTNRLRGWHHSRIIRVSRASGGKDRHSKVLTSKGLRDRRVRLSVATAIQFYDIQDRLGYDQPSKAVDWLIEAASDAIAELPSLNGAFAESPKQLSDEKRGSEGTDGPGGGGEGFDSAEVGIDIDADPGNYHLHQNQHLSLSKSACSSTSETSKGSGLSLSRSEIRVNRVKARERARERTAKEKDKEPNHQQTSLNPSIAQNSSSFTELLTSGIGAGAVGGGGNNNNNNSSSSNNNNNNTPTSTSPSGSSHHHGGEGGLFPKMAASASSRWVSAPMDYFGTGLLGNSLSRTPHHSSGFPGIQMGVATNPLPLQVPPFPISGDGANHHELQAFSFVPDHLIPTAATTTSQAGVSGGEYNLNFTISSSGLGGFSRGTLQSNSSSSPSLLPHHIPRFSSIDGSNVPFFIGTATSVVENHHHNHHISQFPSGLQLCYGDGTRHSDQKGKTKN